MLSRIRVYEIHEWTDGIGSLEKFSQVLLWQHLTLCGCGGI
jgi:hypothetical protein